MLPTFDDQYPVTRDAARLVAVHIIARARAAATGRFGLRITPGGFGTPEFGPSNERLRVSGSVLLRESAGVAGSWCRTMPLPGASLAELAVFAEIDLGEAFSVGHDTPPIGDITAPLDLDESALRGIGTWFGMVAASLDEAVAHAPASAGPTVAQLWPEHFDVALDLQAAEGRRVNLGGSAGDAFHPEPYLYVGPWTDDRPGDTGFWNAPFGAVLGAETLAGLADPVDRAAAFFERGVSLLAR